MDTMTFGKPEYVGKLPTRDLFHLKIERKGIDEGGWPIRGQFGDEEC